MKKVLSMILSMVMVVCILPTVSADVTTSSVAYGDIDGDFRATANDALYVLGYAVGKFKFNKILLSNADVSGDGVVNAEDALLILQRSVDKITHFPIEDPSAVEPPSVDTTPKVVQIHPNNFPDEWFYEYVCCEIDLNEDYRLSEYEISKVTELYVGNYWYYPEDPDKIPYHEITTLKGIEFFTELEILSCNNICLTELDVSKNTKLKELDCSDNLELTSLDVSNNPLLEKLNCNRTGITEIDLTNNTNLTSVACDSDVEVIGYTGKRTEY